MAKGSTKKENTSTSADSQDVSDEAKAAAASAMETAGVEGYIDEEEAAAEIYVTMENISGIMTLEAAANPDLVYLESPTLTSTNITSAKIDYTNTFANYTIGTGNVSDQDVWSIIVTAPTEHDSPVPTIEADYSEAETAILSSIAGVDDNFDVGKAIDTRIDDLVALFQNEEIPLKSFNRIITKGKL